MPTSRRNFLQQTGLLAAGMVGCGGALALPGGARAIEPIVRNGIPKFKFSVAAYSYRRLLQGDSAELTLADFIDDCARWGAEGVELTSYYFPDQPTADYLRQLKGQCFRLGLGISGTAIRDDLCYSPGEQRDAEIAHVKRWIDYAEILGAPVIRIFSGTRRGNQTLQDAHRLAVEGLEECCDYAGQHGVFLALENHGGLTTTVEGLLALVRDVKSPWFGVNLDSGNFRSADPYGDLAKIAPYTFNAQIKVEMPTGDHSQPKVPTDYPRLAQIMRDAGYRGYIVLEYEESDDPREACPRHLAEIRAAFS